MVNQLAMIFSLCHSRRFRIFLHKLVNELTTYVAIIFSFYHFCKIVFIFQNFSKQIKMQCNFWRRECKVVEKTNRGASSSISGAQRPLPGPLSLAPCQRRDLRRSKPLPSSTHQPSSQPSDGPTHISADLRPRQFCFSFTWVTNLYFMLLALKQGKPIKKIMSDVYIFYHFYLSLHCHSYM